MTTKEGILSLVMIVPWRAPMTRARGHAHDEGGPPGPVLRRPHQCHRDGGADRADEAHREVDLAEEQGVELGHARAG